MVKASLQWNMLEIDRKLSEMECTQGIVKYFSLICKLCTVLLFNVWNFSLRSIVEKIKERR